MNGTFEKGEGERLSKGRPREVGSSSRAPWFQALNQGESHRALVRARMAGEPEPEDQLTSAIGTLASALAALRVREHREPQPSPRPPPVATARAPQLPVAYIEARAHTVLQISIRGCDRYYVIWAAPRAPEGHKASNVLLDRALDLPPRCPEFLNLRVECRRRCLGGLPDGLLMQHSTAQHTTAQHK